MTRRGLHLLRDLQLRAQAHLRDMGCGGVEGIYGRVNGRLR